MSIVDGDALEPYLGTVSSLADAATEIAALKANLEVLRRYGMGSENAQSLEEIARAVKADDLKGTITANTTGAITDEKVIIDSSSNTVTYSLSTETYRNGYTMKLYIKDATNTIKVGANGNTINNGSGDYTVTGGAGTVVFIDYWGSGTGFSVREA